MSAEIRRRLRFAARSLVIYSLSIVLFEYLLVRVFQTLPLGTLRPVLETLPRALQAVLGSEFERLLSAEGFLAIVFTHPVILVLLGAFPIAYAAGALAGEVEARTIALVLVRPISRKQVAASVALTVIFGVAFMAASLWGGVALWSRLRGLGPINLAAFAWAAASGAAAFWTIGGVALLASAATSESGRAAGIGIAFALGSYMANYLANLSPGWHWLARYSLFAYWDPQGVIRRGGVVWPDVGVLIALTVLSIGLAVVIFDRRDIPV